MKPFEGTHYPEHLNERRRRDLYGNVSWKNRRHWAPRDEPRDNRTTIADTTTLTRRDHQREGPSAQDRCRARYHAYRPRAVHWS
jgi:hypothetical protein